MPPRLTLMSAMGLMLLVPGCAGLVPHWPGQAASGAVEPLRAAAIGGDTVMVRVGTNGCTRKSDLVPEVRRTFEGAHITLVRIRADTCDSAEADAIELRWSFEEMGLEPGTTVRLTNPYRPLQG